MISDTKTLINFLGDHNMSPEQFLLCWIHYLDWREYKGEKFPEEGSQIANIYRYIERVGKFDRRDINDLIQRGYLINTSNDGRIHPDELRVTEKFIDEVFATQDDFDRFWDAYPSFVPHWDNPREEIPLQFCDMEKCEKIFKRRVTSKVEFERLMEAIEYGKEHDMIKCNALKFLSGEAWKQILEQKREGREKVITTKQIN